MSMAFGFLIQRSLVWQHATSTWRWWICAPAIQNNSGRKGSFFFLFSSSYKKKKKEGNIIPALARAILTEFIFTRKIASVRQHFSLRTASLNRFSSWTMILLFCGTAISLFFFFPELKFTFLDDMDFGLNFDTGHRVQHERAHTVFPTTSTQSFSAERVDCFQVSLRITFWITPFDSKRPCHYKAAFSNEYDSTLCLRSPTSLHFCFAAVSFIVIISSTQPLLCTILFCVCVFFFVVMLN